jgi:hypothetical protein
MSQPDFAAMDDTSLRKSGWDMIDVSTRWRLLISHAHQPPIHAYSLESHLQVRHSSWSIQRYHASQPSQDQRFPHGDNMGMSLAPGYLFDEMMILVYTYGAMRIGSAGSNSPSLHMLDVLARNISEGSVVSFGCFVMVILRNLIVNSVSIVLVKS